MSLPAHHLTVPRTARYFLLGEPDSADEIWFLLHGYGQLAASFVRWFEPAARPGRLLVAPEGLSRAYFEEQGARRVGASWMTREDREAEMADYVQYLDLLADQLVGELPPTPPILVHGFSQGTATACRWVSLGRHQVHRLVLWGGLVPPDLDLERLATRLREAQFHLIIGEQDPYLGSEQIAAEQARLSGAGIEVSVHRFPGGHRIDLETLKELSRSSVGGATT